MLHARRTGAELGTFSENPKWGQGLRTRRGDAELWSIDRVYGRERSGVRALLHSRRREKADQPDSTHPGVSNLPRAVAESEPARDDRRLDLDGRGHRVRSLENARVPRTTLV